MSRGLIAELREMRAALADLNRRVRGMVVHGTVRAVEGDRVRLTLDAGPGGDVVSPAVRWQEMAGHSGGGTTTWMPPAIGERMMLVSPSGEIGSHSIAMRGCYTAADGKPADEAGMYFKVGDTVFAATGDGVSIKATAFAVEAETISLKGAGGVAIDGPTHVTGAHLTHNAKNVGDTHTHGGVTPGGARTGTP